MRFFLGTTLLLAVAALLAVAVSAQEHSAMPPGMSHEEHLALMKKDADLKARGTLAMGFNQDAATHHFVLTAQGGSIEVGANHSGDTSTRRQIRTHLREIAKDFRRGNFAKPLATHAEVPPGVPVMRQLQSKIAWKYSETPSGATIHIETRDPVARDAIHDFLRYQIREHKTGDPESMR